MGVFSQCFYHNFVNFLRQNVPQWVECPSCKGALSPSHNNWRMFYVVHLQVQKEKDRANLPKNALSLSNDNRTDPIDSSSFLLRNLARLDPVSKTVLLLIANMRMPCKPEMATNSRDYLKWGTNTKQTYLQQ